MIAWLMSVLAALAALFLTSAALDLARRAPPATALSRPVSWTPSRILPSWSGRPFNIRSFDAMRLKRKKGILYLIADCEGASPPSRRPCGPGWTTFSCGKRISPRQNT